MTEYSTSSDVYMYCQVCRINHTQKRKHIFTNKHKQKMKDIFKRFGAKVKLCRPYLENPVIQEGEYEPGATFWCYFCQNNFIKHVSDCLKSIINGGILEHLASEEHCQATERFWRENGAEQKLKVGFILSENDYESYKEKLIALVDKYDAKQNEKRKHTADDIKMQENQRLLSCAGVFQAHSSNEERVVYRTLRNQYGVLQNPTGYHDNVRVWKGGIVKYKEQSDQIIPPKFSTSKNRSSSEQLRPSSFVYTVSAEGPGLSKVSINVDRNRGNVYSGALPPWLMKDIPSEDDKTNNIVFGPSEEDFLKHKKKMEKSKLNPNRVGVNFNHAITPGNSDWLPSFGRVWNQGARWKSRHEYQGEVASNAKRFKKTE